MDLWQEYETEARETVHVTSSLSGETVDLLKRTISMYAEGLRLAQVPDNSDASLVQAGLISQSFNSLKAAVDLACRGFYIQSVSLVRGVYENWLALWYISEYPSESCRWLMAQPGHRPPKAETMRKKISYPSKAVKSKLQQFYSELSRFAHTDSVAVIPLFAQVAEGRVVHHGVQYNADHFCGAAYSIFLWADQFMGALGLWVPETSPWHEKQSRHTRELLKFVDQCNAKWSDPGRQGHVG